MGARVDTTERGTGRMGEDEAWEHGGAPGRGGDRRGRKRQRWLAGGGGSVGMAALARLVRGSLRGCRPLAALAPATRSHTCGQLRAAHVGQPVTLCGWLQNIRSARPRQVCRPALTALAASSTTASASSLSVMPTVSLRSSFPRYASLLSWSVSPSLLASSLSASRFIAFLHRAYPLMLVWLIRACFLFFNQLSLLFLPLMQAAGHPRPRHPHRVHCPCHRSCRPAA